jgi:hypothetical protein
VHRPGGPESAGARSAHWPAIDVPALLLSGTSDPFARIDLLEAAMPTLRRGTRRVPQAGTACCRCAGRLDRSRRRRPPRWGAEPARYGDPAPLPWWPAPPSRADRSSRPHPPGNHRRGGREPLEVAGSTRDLAQTTRCGARSWHSPPRRAAAPRPSPGAAPLPPALLDPPHVPLMDGECGPRCRGCAPHTRAGSGLSPGARTQIDHGVDAAIRRSAARSPDTSGWCLRARARRVAIVGVSHRSHAEDK